VKEHRFLKQHLEIIILTSISLSLTAFVYFESYFSLLTIQFIVKIFHSISEALLNSR